MMKWPQTHVITARLLILSLFALLALPLLTGCGSNPQKSVQELDTRAYALYGTFVVFEEQAALIIKQPATPANVKAMIRSSDAAAKPVADALLVSVKEYLRIKEELDAGTTTNDKLVIATANLEKWVLAATPVIQQLVMSVRSK